MHILNIYGTYTKHILTQYIYSIYMYIYTSVRVCVHIRKLICIHILKHILL
jgi:hypothetical protein